MAQFHTDSIAYERKCSNCFVCADRVQFPSRRYSPDEIRICYSCQTQRPEVYSGRFFCSRFGLIVGGFTTIQSKSFVVKFTLGLATITQAEGEQKMNDDKQTCETTECNEKIDTYQEIADQTQQNDVQNATSKQSENVAKPLKTRTQRSVAYIAKLAILSALAVILLYIECPVVPATPGLKMIFSDIPTLLASFMFGPVSGTVVNAVKVGVCLLLRGTTTAFVGDLSNLVSGTLYAVVAGLVYKFHKNKKGAIVALIVSSIVFCASMWLCNQLFLLPMFGMTDFAQIMVCLWWTLLFNVIKTAVTSVVTFFVYKRTHKLFSRF